MATRPANKLIFMGLLLLASIQAVAEIGPPISDARCLKWGDNLDQNVYIGRVKWALKCEEDEVTLYNIDWHSKGILRTDGQVTGGYPSYAYYDRVQKKFTNPKNWFAPTKESASCSEKPAGYRLAFFCASGCYTPEQELLFSHGSEKISTAHNKLFKSIMTLSPNSSMADVTLKETPVRRYISDVVDGMHTILEFVTASGGKLRVTTNHPLIDGEGMIRQAVSFSKGDYLVKADGSPDLIIGIKEQQHYGKVYNVETQGASGLEQIVVGQGYLNGSLYYQNQGVNELNRKLLRRNIASYFIE